MAEFQTNKETQASIEKIISNANKQLVLVSPYINLTTALYTRLKGCAERGVSIKIIYRTGELKDSKILELGLLKNVEIRFMNDLHAKCYFNENEMIVTSLNLLESSERNWEMGILIDRINDKAIYDKAIREVQTIFEGGNINTFPSSKNNSPATMTIKGINKSDVNNGYCIRCEGRIPFNKDKPLCRSCYNLWNEWGDGEYPEKYCHFSGKVSAGKTCFSRPVLKENWEKAKKLQ